MKAGTITKIIVAVVLLGVAAVGFVRFFNRDDGISEQTFFYDLSEKKLFAASREALPPIRGLNDAEADAVRAVVISVNGDPEDPASRRVAYLEQYTPELKKSLELVREGKAEPLPSKVRNGYRLVKREEDTVWHKVNSPEGEKILNAWNVPGPDGKMPVVCVP